ncbi:MAG TPA: hypothetical protein VLH75_05980 [Longimicrobiales bacterium]|nr:hypothetical protein [Longimicrobiales bacterium]
MSELHSETLRVAAVRLSATWEGVSAEWRDPVAAEFARRFLGPLQETIDRYLEAVRELEAALEDVERD